MNPETDVGGADVPPSPLDALPVLVSPEAAAPAALEPEVVGATLTPILPRTCCTIVLGAVAAGALDTLADAMLLTSATPDVTASGVVDVLTGKTSTIGGEATIGSAVTAGVALATWELVVVTDGVTVGVGDGVGDGGAATTTDDPADGLTTPTCPPNTGDDILIIAAIAK